MSSEKTVKNNNINAKIGKKLDKEGHADQETWHAKENPEQKSVEEL